MRPLKSAERDLAAAVGGQAESGGLIALGQGHMPSFRRFRRVNLTASMGWEAAGGQDEARPVRNLEFADLALGHSAGPHAPDKGTSDRA